MGDAFGRLAAHVVKMARRPADDGAERNDGIKLLRFRHFFREERNFKCARHPGDRDVIVADAMARQTVDRP